MFSFKDLEKVSLKATYNIEIGNRKIVPGETIAFFDRIQVATLDEEKAVVAATGGFDNRPHVFWETTKDLSLRFTQGVFSKEHFALLTNARLIEQTNAPVLITEHEEKESNENGVITLKYAPVNIFIYNKATGARITEYTLDGTTLTLTVPYLEVLIDYTFNYINSVLNYKIGKQLINGFVELEGRTRIKDDVTGQVVTGIIKIPKLKLLSELSVRLGEQANPVAGNFDAMGIPVGSRGSTYVSEFIMLGDDIESDL